MKAQGCSKKSGFTLFELIISLVVISILSGVSYRMCRSVPPHADNSQRLLQGQKFQQMFSDYFAEYGNFGVFPVRHWFDLRNKKFDFCNSFSGKKEQIRLNPKQINFFQKAMVETNTKPAQSIWFFLDDVGFCTDALAKLSRLRHQNCQEQLIHTSPHVCFYLPEPGEDFRTLLERQIERERNSLNQTEKHDEN